VTRRPISAAWAEAPAKVNLGLAVTGRRADGYHTLDSIFLRLTLHDHLEARLAAEPHGPDELVVSGDAWVPVEDNIVGRAVAALRRSTGRPLPALRLRLEKHIPAAAGLGGGSSDAAAGLRLAARVWELPEGEPAPGVAVGLGADVPFFAAGLAAARATGIGEMLEPLPAPDPAAGVLIIVPPHRLATAAVFAALEDAGPDVEGGPGRSQASPDSQERVRELAAALRSGSTGPDLATLAPRLRDANDLWAPASRLLPALPPMRDLLEGRLGRALLLSGSGPALVAFYPSPEDVTEAAASLEAAGSTDLRGATIIATSTSRGGAT
jgi:4-diphosphocytidyl-2-C-methyl-D-erythritol kinase